MRMSSRTLFVLVEGKNIDPFFYAQLVSPVCKDAGIAYEIIRSDFVAGSGGKQTLLELHKYLASVDSLTYDAENGRKHCIFFLDKDVDDTLCKLVRSKHLVYTPFYSVENALFAHGQLVLASAAAASLDPGDVVARIPDPAAWRRQVAELWREFLILSLLSVKIGAHCACHYASMTSPLNTPADSPTDMVRAVQVRSALRTASGLGQQKFDLKLQAVRRYVQRVYGKGWHDVLFNGKWYFEPLRREMSLIPGAGAHNKPSNGALISALSSSLDFSAGWADHFKQPLRDLLGHA